MGLDLTADPAPVERGEKGTLYRASHGSGGFKASYEAVTLWYKPTETDPFHVRFSSPIGGESLGTFERLAPAIEKAIAETRSRLTRTINGPGYTRTEAHRNAPEGTPEELLPLLE